MNEQELLRQIAGLFHENNEVLVEMMDDKIAKNNEVLLQRVGEMIDERVGRMIDASESRMARMMDTKIDAAKTEILATIENTVSRKIDVLFDGYADVQARQGIMQQQIDDLAGRMDSLELLVRTPAV